MTDAPFLEVHSSLDDIVGRIGLRDVLLLSILFGAKLHDQFASMDCGYMKAIGTNT